MLSGRTVRFLVVSSLMLTGAWLGYQFAAVESNAHQTAFAQPVHCGNDYTSDDCKKLHTVTTSTPLMGCNPAAGFKVTVGGRYCTGLFSQVKVFVKCKNTPTEFGPFYVPGTQSGFGGPLSCLCTNNLPGVNDAVEQVRLDGGYAKIKDVTVNVQCCDPPCEPPAPPPTPDLECGPLTTSFNAGEDQYGNPLCAPDPLILPIPPSNQPTECGISGYLVNVYGTACSSGQNPEWFDIKINCTLSSPSYISHVLVGGAPLYAFSGATSNGVCTGLGNKIASVEFIGNSGNGLPGSVAPTVHSANVSVRCAGECP